MKIKIISIVISVIIFLALLATVGQTAIQQIVGIAIKNNTTGAWENVTTSGLTVVSGTAGSNMYAIKKTNLTIAASNLTFGFTSAKVMVSAPSTNTEDICINWINQTVTCPATDTAGNDRLAPGTSISLDNFATIGISAASNSGTQTINVRAFK